MNEPPKADYASNALSDRNFNRVSKFIHERIGIFLPETKRKLLEGRLGKRMKITGISSISDYCDYLFTAEGIKEEISHMVDAVTTNKTDFFREAQHFAYLTDKALPELTRIKVISPTKRALIWSSACSTGEEPYTLAMVLSEYAKKSNGFDFSILATDISSQVLGKAELAVYESEKIEPVPLELRKKYLLKSRDTARSVVRIVPELRQKVAFSRMNLIGKPYRVPDNLHVIFCRNVLIYFDEPTQEMVIRQFCKHLVPGGYLFLGHSETLKKMDVPLEYVAPTVYRKC